ncbi:SLC13 family permease [Horticoccus luteus]|uniref:SLC13 family permease n=1 Tax=Horticoccus luteus TaxID=2862869 RepID=A0A8F9TUC0_9BACT|nr:SLC13 family permease [Horticoccus luteus]QYM77928.1 SLC13 family permease [Horticoccus luteus]
MTFQIGLLLSLIAVALVFFSLEWVSADVVGLGLLLALVLTGLLPAERAFASFGSDTVLMILGLLIMTAALLKTGVVDLAGRAILKYAGTRVNPLLFVIMLGVGTLSAFISNTAATAFFVPVVMGLAVKARTSPSRLLMPVAFASILSSSVTLISTSTNLVINGLLTSAHLRPMTMFELTPVGLPIALVGLLYMFFIGRRFIPERASAQGAFDTFGMRSYLTEVLVLPDSPLVGQTLGESNLGRELDLSVLRVVRGERYLLPQSDMVIAAGDVLLVEGERADVLHVKDTAGIEIRPEMTLSEPDLRSEDAALVEALIVPGSPFIGRTLRGLGFRENFGLQVLGVNRHGRNLLRKLGQIALRVGDVLLIQGRRTRLVRLNTDRAISILNAVEDQTIDHARAWRATLIFVASLALAVTNLVPLAVAVLLGAFAVLATRCVSPADAYREVEWRVVILIACMLALGAAMTATGTAEYLASLVAGVTAHASPLWLLAGFFLLTVALTQPMSNQAAAAVILPIAIHTAQNLHLNPRTFAMTIAIAASCSYITPLEPACLMVYGPGRYRFSDFPRVGAPLVLIIFVLVMLLAPHIWPLR